jgi:hypothetical protein
VTAWQLRLSQFHLGPEAHCVSEIFDVRILDLCTGFQAIHAALPVTGVGEGDGKGKWDRPICASRAPRAQPLRNRIKIDVQASRERANFAADPKNPSLSGPAVSIESALQAGPAAKSSHRKWRPPFESPQPSAVCAEVS